MQGHGGAVLGASACPEAVATSDMSVQCSARRCRVRGKEWGCLPCASGFLSPRVAKYTYPYFGSGCKYLVQGQKTSGVCAAPAVAVLGRVMLTVWGAAPGDALDSPPTLLPFHCRWGEEQLPDGQTQKYWVSVGGWHEHVGAWALEGVQVLLSHTRMGFCSGMGGISWVPQH